MSNLFQFIMYMIFGKRWIKYDMIQGYKMAIFVNEAEIEMDKNKMEDARKRVDDLTRELALLEEMPFEDVMNLLSDDQKEDKREIAKMEYKQKQERAEQIQTFKNRIKSAEQDIQLADGALQKTYSIAYTNRRKYDFMKNYKVKATYADNNK